MPEARVVSASREIAAGPEPIFELIADPALQPRWDGNDNLAEAAAGQRVRQVGDVFIMTLTGDGAIRHNHVVEFEEGRLIAWMPSEPGQDRPGHLWRWELEPAGQGRTRATITYDWTRLTDESRLARARATTADKLRASLDLLAAEAETPGEGAGERIEVQRMIAADAAAIFRVLCDPQGHVAIDSAGMLMDATGDLVTGAGDSFVVHMDREALNDYPMGHYDVTVTITTFVPDREIAWTILGRMRPQIGHVYSYRLEPAAEGTLVTSYYDWSSIHPDYRKAGIFPVISEGALRATLGILARTVARGYPGSGG